MKVSRKTHETTFEKLTAGDFFEFNNGYYIKADRAIGAKHNSMNVSNGNLVAFGNCVIVDKIDAEIIVK